MTAVEVDLNAPNYSIKVDEGDELPIALTGPSLDAGGAYVATFKPSANGAATQTLTVDLTEIAQNRIRVTLPVAAHGTLKIKRTNPTTRTLTVALVIARP